MATVSTMACVPSIIEGGTTVRFSVSNASYSALLWTLQFVLNDGANAPLIVTGTPSGTGFIVTLTATQTTALKPGRFTWAEIFTSIADTSEKASGNDGIVDVLPSVTATATPSKAQAMVTLLEGALAEFAATTKASVQFNSQSFSRASIATYQQQLTYWQARVIKEQNDRAALRGNRAGGEIGIVFDSPRAQFGTGYSTWLP